MGAYFTNKKDKVLEFVVYPDKEICNYKMLILNNAPFRNQRLQRIMEYL